MKRNRKENRGEKKEKTYLMQNKVFSDGYYPFRVFSPDGRRGTIASRV